MSPRKLRNCGTQVYEELVFIAKDIHKNGILKYLNLLRPLRNIPT